MSQVAGRVTIAIPVFRRLTYLPQALEAAAAQRYDDIELIVSDNGPNGDRVATLARRHYPRPLTFRQNAVSAPIVDHLNQLLAATTGEFFVLLCDDDWIKDEFVSDLVAALRRHPRADVALARPETMDAAGGSIRGFASECPEVLDGDAFVRAWATKRIPLMSTITHMSRTVAARAHGYDAFPRGLYSDGMLLLKLALGRQVVFGNRAVFRWRMDDGSFGFSVPFGELAAVCRQFIAGLESDTTLRAYAASHPEQWRVLRPLLVEQCLEWYYARWYWRYARALPVTQWVRAACAVPPTRKYARRVMATFWQRAGEWTEVRVPPLKSTYRVARRGASAAWSVARAVAALLAAMS